MEILRFLEIIANLWILWSQNHRDYLCLGHLTSICCVLLSFFRESDTWSVDEFCIAFLLFNIHYNPITLFSLMSPGVYFVASLPGKCRWVQLCAGVRMFPAQESHVPRVWDVGTELVRLSQAEQVLAAPSQVYSSHPTPGKSTHISYMLFEVLAATFSKEF